MKRQEQEKDEEDLLRVTFFKIIVNRKNDRDILFSLFYDPSRPRAVPYRNVRLIFTMVAFMSPMRAVFWATSQNLTKSLHLEGNYIKCYVRASILQLTR